MLENENKLCDICAFSTSYCLSKDAVVYFLRDGGKREDLIEKFPSLPECTQSQDLLDESVPIESLVSDFDDWDCTPDNLESDAEDSLSPPEDKKPD